MWLTISMAYLVLCFGVLLLVLYHWLYRREVRKVTTQLHLNPPELLNYLLHFNLLFSVSVALLLVILFITELL